MADIISNIQKINDLEVGANKPVTTSLFTKIGASINGLIDGRNITTFTASGSYQVPEQTTQVLVFGCGGGGGGGASAGQGDNSPGGGGGFGAHYFSHIVDVTPLANITITIGAGGAGGTGPSGGGAGGTTNFGSLLGFPGGAGGDTGALGFLNDGVGTVYQGQSIGGNWGAVDADAGFAGGASERFAGGTGGAGGGAGGSGGGGGGASFFGVGGNGGASKGIGAGTGNSGTSPASTSYGAAGGGGGGGGDATVRGPGAAGRSGILLIYTMN